MKRESVIRSGDSKGSAQLFLSQGVVDNVQEKREGAT